MQEKRRNGEEVKKKGARAWMEEGRRKFLKEFREVRRDGGSASEDGLGGREESQEERVSVEPLLAAWGGPRGPAAPLEAALHPS